MRIRNPPTFIMSISFIMSLIMTLLVFQCGDAAVRRRATGGVVQLWFDGWSSRVLLPAEGKLSVLS